jgi:hypothetical protein
MRETIAHMTFLRRSRRWCLHISDQEVALGSLPSLQHVKLCSHVYGRAEICATHLDVNIYDLVGTADAAIQS